MTRISPVYYIAPSSIGITPNVNGTYNDLAVYVANGTKIRVYSPRAGIGMEDGKYKEWTLSGRNRRLEDSTKPYTIYARISKNGSEDGYLIFAPKILYSGVWCDRYPYVTQNGEAANSANIGNYSDRYYYIRLGDVSLPENGERTVTFDTGILGTEQFNNEYSLNPDALPLRIELGCTIDDEDVGANPYVYWDQSLVLTATLVEGWTGTDIKRFNHWEIARSSGSASDSSWPTQQRQEAFSSSGSITLRHTKGSDDDFASAVSALYTITAWGHSEDPEDQDLVVLATACISILAETVEKYEMSFSADVVGFNPQTETYSPSGGVAVRFRATDQRGDVFMLTKKQYEDSGLSVSYAPLGSSSWTVLTPAGGDASVATVTVPVSAFEAHKSVNIRLTNAAGKELATKTIAFVRDGEDSKEREWIFLRSIEAIVFGDGIHPYPSDIPYGEVEPTGAAGHVTNDKNQDGWVPEGWYDEMQGTDRNHRYEYGAYRDFVHDETNGDRWGDFTTPKMWSHYGKDGKSAARLIMDHSLVTVKTDYEGAVIDDVDVLIQLDAMVDGAPLLIDSISIDEGGETHYLTFGSMVISDLDDVVLDGHAVNVGSHGTVDGNTIVLDDGFLFSSSVIKATIPAGTVLDEHLALITVNCSDASGENYQCGGVLEIVGIANGKNADEPMPAYQWNESSSVAPSPLPNGENLGNWSKTAGNRPETTGEYFLWMTQTMKHITADGVVTIDAWSQPVRISGNNGSNGEDGSDMEYIYILKAQPTDFSGDTLPKNISRGKVHGQGEWIPKADQYATDDYVPEGWSDNPAGVDNTNKYEYMSWRRKPKGIDQQWGDFSTPVMWSHYGRNGVDGDGVEYVYIRTKNAIAPILDQTQTGYTEAEFLPAISNSVACEAESGRTTDDALGVDAVYRYEWVAKRTMTDPDATTGQRTWTKYQGSKVNGTYDYKMSLWAYRPENITKKSEIPYYIKNTTGVRPAENDPAWSETRPTVGQGEWLFTKIVITWSDNSTTVLYTDERNPNDGQAGQDIIVDGATEMKYCCTQSSTTHPTEDSSDWKDLSQVTQTQGWWLWSKATTWYRKAGSTAGAHDAGKSVNYNVGYIAEDGDAGRGIQSITEYYQATNSSAARQRPTSASGWDTDPNLSGLTDKWDQSHKYLWNMEKTVYSNPDGTTTTEYSIPQILAIWTKDGAAGKGIDSIVNYYQATNSIQPPARAHEGGTGWDDNPVTPNATSPYLWNYEVITWVNPAGTTYTAVQMIGHYGKDGISVKAQYSADGTSWHDAFTTGDEWMRTSTDNGTTWSSAMKIVGENGSETDFSFGISQYKTTASAQTAPGDISSWSDAPIATTAAKPYLWAKVQYKNGDGSVLSTSYIRFTGEDGKSITKTGESYRYATNNTGTRPAASSTDWKTTKPTLQKGYWLYTETTITWSDNSTTVLYTDERNPNDGLPGQDIIVDGATVMKYYVGDSNSTHPAENSSDWKDLDQVTQTQGKWLWSQATTWYKKADSATGAHDAGKSVNYNVSYIAKDGAAGRGVTGVTEYYKATDSNAAMPAPTSDTGWSTDPNLADLQDKWDENHKFLWNYEKIQYSSGTTIVRTIPQIVAIWTKDGRGIDSIQNYYKTTDSDVAPSKPSTHGTDGWDDNPMTPNATNPYLWNYEVVTYTDETTYESDVQLIGHYGKNITKVSDTREYQVSTNGTTVPTGTWLDEAHKPTPSQGQYLWTRLTMLWSDGSSTVLYSTERNPNDGQPGQDIVTDRTEITYAVTDTNQKPADSAFGPYPSSLPQGKWLWSKATTYYKKATSGAAAGSSSNYNVSYIAVDGTSVTYDAEHSSVMYAVSSKGTPEQGRDYPSDITSWSATMPAVQQGKYLWTRDITAYNDGGTTRTTTTYGVSYWGVDGDDVQIDTSRTFVKYSTQKTASKPADNTFTLDVPPSLGQGDYLWALSQTAYIGVADALKSYSVSRVGTDGSQGDPGPDGYTTHFAYATSADGSQGFSVTNFSGATYIGTYRDNEADDSTDYRDYVWTKWKGDTGAAGRGVTEVKEYYKASDKSSGETAPSDDSGWSDDPNTAMAQWGESKKYLWNYERVKYSSGTQYERTTPSVIAIWTKDGAAGKGIDSIVNYYKVTNSLTPPSRTDSGWDDDPVAPNASTPYLWNYEEINWLNPTGKTYTAVQMIGHYGKDGISVKAQYSADGTSWHDAFTTGDEWMRTSTDNGTTWSTAMKIVGENGSETDFSFGISQYKTTDSAQTAPGDISSWSDAPIATTAAKPYLWAKVQYKNGDGSVLSTSYIRFTGEDGKSITKNSETYKYATNNTGVRPAAGSADWKTTKPTLQKGYWLYTETTITWSDNSTTVLYTDERNPNDGLPGQDIIVDGSTVIKYYVGSSNSTHPAEDSADWKDLDQVTQTQGKWLWSQATTWYKKADSAAGAHDAGKSVNYNVSYIAKDGAAGRGLTGVTEYYKASNSTTAPAVDDSQWDTDPNLSHRPATEKWDKDHIYLWNYEKMEYSSGTSIVRTTPQIVAIWTKDGRGIDSITNYYKVTNSSTAPAKTAEGWSTAVVSPDANNQYLWNYEVVTYTDSTTYESDVQLIGHFGQNITKQSETVQYKVADDGTTTPTGTWYDTKAAAVAAKPWAADKYMWTKTDIEWSDASHTILYSAERNPNDGQPGQSIIVDGATVMKYYVGDSNSTHPADGSSDWKDLSQVTQIQGKWLWSQATTYYRKANSTAGSHDAGSSINYNVSYIAKDGEAGRGIQSITEYYQATNSSAARQKPTSASGWDTDPNLSSLTDKWNESHKYLWNMEKTVYSNSDGTTSTEYSTPQILAIWTKDGRGVDSITNFYKKADASSGVGYPASDPDGQGSAHSGGTATGWSSSVQVPDASNPYLWNYERVTWIESDGTNTYTYTNPHVIGHFGKDGTNAITMDIDNEMDSIPCDSEAVVTSATTLTTKARIYDGANPVTSGVTVKSIEKIAGVTATRSVASGVVTVSWAIAKDAVMSGDKFTPRITLTYGGKDYSAVFTANVVKSGEPGVSPTIYQLAPSRSSIAFHRDSTGAIEESSIALTMAIKKSYENTTEEITIAASGLTVRYSYTEMPATSSSGTAFPASLAVTSDKDNVFVAAFNGSTLVDKETIPVVVDGAKGSVGPNGYNTAAIALYQRYAPTAQAATPALPNGVLVYTFSTGAITEKTSGTGFNGWSKTIPAYEEGKKLFVTMATARSQSASDEIAANEWAGAVEYVADGEAGKNAIRLALDNEHEDFIYDDAGANKSGNATSAIHLYDGTEEVTSGFTLSVVLNDNTKTYGVPTSGTNAPSISNGILTVKALNANTAKVTVTTSYKGESYYAAFTANKTSQDKYELSVSPNAVTYNQSQSFDTQTITLGGTRTDKLGNKTTLAFGSGVADISNVAGSGTLRLYAIYTHQTGPSTYSDDPVQLTSASFSCTGQIAYYNTGVKFELRKYSDSTHYTLVDHETLDVAKVNNGNSYASVTIFKRSDSAPSDKPDNNARYYFKDSGDIKAGSLVAPSGGSLNGWTIEIPSGTQPVWQRHATALALATSTYDTIADTEWSGDANGKAVKFVENGATGEAAVNVVVTPASLIVNQSLEDTGNLDSLSEQILFSVMKGSTALSVTKIDTIVVEKDGSRNKIAVSGSNSYYATLTAILKDADTNGNYYDSAYFTCRVAYTDGGTTKYVTGVKVYVYANLLGTWKEDVVGDVNTAIATSINYLYDPNNPNQVVKQTNYAEYVQSSTQSISRIEQTVEGGNENLIMNGAFISDTSNWTEWGNPTTREIVSSGGKKWMHIKSTTAQYEGFNQRHYTDYGITVKANTKYTISLRAKAASGTPTVSVGFHWFTGNGNIVSQTWQNFAISTTENVYSAQLTVPANIDNFNVMVGDKTTSVQEFYITEIKLEQGEIATAWSDNHSDSYSEIKQTASGITSQVNALDGRVTTVEQTADGLTSTVKASTGRNHFSFTACQFRQASEDCGYPAVQSYGMLLKFAGSTDGNGRLARVRIPSLETGKSYTLSCQIKMTSAAAHIEIDLGDTSGGLKTIEATTSWQDIEVTLPLNTASKWIDFGIRSQDYTAGNYALLRHIKLEEGKTATAFCIANEDVNSVSNVRPVDAWTFNDGKIAEDPTVTCPSGKKVYKTLSLPDAPTSTSNKYIDYIYKNDLTTIEIGKVYTLSFWVKSSVANTHLMGSYLYPDISLGQNQYFREYDGQEETIRTDGATYIRVTTEWKKHYIYFYVMSKQDSGLVSSIPFRLIRTYNESWNNSGTVYISDVQFCEGYVSEDNATVNESYTEIKQTANDIKLFVTDGLENTGINITNGTIDLTAAKIVMSSGGQGQTIVQGGKIKADYIDAQAVVTNALTSSTITANNATINNIKLGNADVSGKITASSGSITGALNVTGSLQFGNDDAYHIVMGKNGNNGSISMYNGSNTSPNLIISVETNGSAVFPYISLKRSQEYLKIYPYNITLRATGSTPSVNDIDSRGMVMSLTDDSDSSKGVQVNLYNDLNTYKLNFRAYDKNGDSAWPAANLNNQYGGMSDKGHVHSLTFAQLKTIFDNTTPGAAFANMLSNCSVLIVRTT